MIEIEVAFGGKVENRQVFGTQQLPLLIGRGSDADIIVENSMVSRRHALIDMVGNKLVIADQDSDNGFAIRGREIGRVAEIQDGDVIVLGKHDVKVGIKLVKALEDGERRLKRMSAEDLDATVKMAKQKSGVGPEGVVHKLMVTAPTTRSCPLHAFQIWIGSNEVNDIVVRGFGIGRRHLLIYWDGSRHHACDVTGKKKVKVNGAGIDDVALSAGDQIKLGALVMEYR